MTSLQQEHPPEEQLLAFAQGRLAGPESSAVESHLLSCDSCCERLSGQPENTLLALAREVATVGFLAPPIPAAIDSTEVPAALVDHPRYRVVDQIGVGGMGAVYRAEHRLMQRMVALKIIHPRLISNPQVAERFHREMRVAAKLAHPNIVTSFDADHADSLHFLVMEYVAGESLDRCIGRDGPASIADACDWIRQAALGLQHAHEQGMAHRDIKPHNLMLTPEGQIKILDFGLSRIVSEEGLSRDGTAPLAVPSSATHAEAILGTPDYIAPEQIVNSRSADIRADIYSLGCTLYFLLTGKPPFGTGSVQSRLAAHATQPFPRLADSRSDAPSHLAAILGRMTAKAPGDRYASPGELADDLAQLMGEIDPARAKASAASPARKSPTNSDAFSPLHLAGIGATFVATVFAMAWGIGLLGSSPVKMLVLMPSKGLYYPDYQELVNAAAKDKIQLVFASITLNPSEVSSGSPPGEAVPDIKLDGKTTADPYQAVVVIGYDTADFCPGGAAGDDTRRLLTEFQRQKKVVASLCAGQRALAQHGALRGKRVSPCESVRADEITIEGGTRGLADVEVDGRVVTASHARSAPEFLKAIEKSLAP